MVQNRSLVLVEAPKLPQSSPPETLEMFFSKHLEAFSKRLDGWRRLRGAYGVAKLRKILQISQGQFSELLEPFMDKDKPHRYSPCTISMWEMPSRKRKLPKYYWRDRFPKRSTDKKPGAFDAISRLIIALVEWSSRGNFTARVTGARKWRVELRRRTR